MNKTYQEPILEIRIMDTNDIVRTSDNIGCILGSWKGFVSGSEEEGEK